MMLNKYMGKHFNFHCAGNNCSLQTYRPHVSHSPCKLRVNHTDELLTQTKGYVNHGFQHLKVVSRHWDVSVSIAWHATMGMRCSVTRV